MEVFSRGAVYSFIPKNACSTLRFSVAKANGVVSGLEDINWIHSNNQSFNVNTAQAARAPYSFVILRCPFSRLYSAFMDKIVGLDLPAWELRRAKGRSFEVYDLSFRRFIRVITDMASPKLDAHWRPQSAFLLYDHYDDMFAFEAFSKAIPKIEKAAGLQIIDTRQTLGHDAKRLTKTRELTAPMKLPALKLLNLKQKGSAPDPRDMFDAEMIKRIRSYYAEDFALYEAAFGPSELMKVFA